MAVVMTSGDRHCTIHGATPCECWSRADRAWHSNWNIPAKDLPKATESWSEYKARVPHMFTHGDVTRRIHPKVTDPGDAAMDAFRKRVRGLPFHEAVHVQPPTPKQLGLEEPEPFEHVSAGFEERPDHGTLLGVNDGEWYGLTSADVARAEAKGEAEFAALSPSFVYSADDLATQRRWSIVLGFALGVLSTLVAFVLIAGWLG